MAYSASLTGFLDQLHDDGLDLIVDYIKKLKEKRRKDRLNESNPNQYELFDDPGNSGLDGH